jgi:hypothetical protein
MSNTDYRVLTTKEQNDLIGKLEKANALLAECHACVVGNVPQKVRKPRKAKATPVAAEAPKKRGRPAKAPVAAEPGEI